MGPPPQIRLASYERRCLERMLKKSPSARVHRKASAILLSHEGLSAEEISRLTGYSAASVYAIRMAWRQMKFAALEDKPIPGRPPKITDEYLELLRYSISEGPARFGYVFGSWSLARLAEHLKAITGISVAPGHLSRVLDKLGYSYKRPKHTLKNVCNQKEYKRAKRVLGWLKKGL